MPHETHRVGEGVDPTVLGGGAPRRRVQGGEQGVLDKDTDSGEPIEQGRLSSIGVAHDGHRRNAITLATSSSGGSCGIHLPETSPQHRDPMADPTSIGLDTRLTRTTTADTGAAGSSTTSLTGETLPPTTQPLFQIGELGKFHLGLALGTASMLGEDVEDEGRAIHDLDPHSVLEVAQLGCGEFAVTDDGVGTGGTDQVCQFAYLATAQVGGGIGNVPTLDDPFQHL